MDVRLEVPLPHTTYGAAKPTGSDTRRVDRAFVYQRSAPARLFAGLWVVAALVFGGQLFADDSVAGHLLSAALVALSLAGAVRAWRMNTLVASPENLTVRRFDRTLRLPWTAVRSVEAVGHVNGFRGAGLTLQITDATGPRKLREFFQRSPEGTARVRQIAVELERRRLQAVAMPDQK